MQSTLLVDLPVATRGPEGGRTGRVMSARWSPAGWRVEDDEDEDDDLEDEDEGEGEDEEEDDEDEDEETETWQVGVG